MGYVTINVIVTNKYSEQGIVFKLKPLFIKAIKPVLLWKVDVYECVVGKFILGYKLFDLLNQNVTITYSCIYIINISYIKWFAF